MVIQDVFHPQSLTSWQLGLQLLLLFFHQITAYLCVTLA